MSFFFQHRDEHRHLRSSIVAYLLLVVVIVWLSVLSIRPSSTAVSTQNLRASRQDLAELTKEKHPVGSEAHAKVRDYILQRIEKLGLRAEVQSSFAINPRNNSAAQVHNIVGRLPATGGTQDAATKQQSPALLLVAHYDSVANSYGAGDDGVSVANMLQVIEQLQQQPVRRNDLIFLVTDAEETGLLGAIAFSEQHPWSKEVGLVLNFDNRGNSGPIMMFESSANNGQLIQHMARATPQVVSNSIMYEVYKALPNDTDFTVFRKAGIAGLNFAMIDNFSSYHTHHDTGRDIDPASIAEQQQLMRDLSLHFVQQDLQTFVRSKDSESLSTENRVYFSLPLVGLMHYSNTLGIALTSVVVLGVFALFFWQRRRTSAAELRLHFCFFAGLLFALQLAAFAFLAQRAWIFICRIYPEYAHLRDADNGHFYLLAFILLFATMFVYLQRFLLRWWRPQELHFGVYFVWMLLLLITTVVAPGTSFLFAWPLAVMLLAHAITLRQNKNSAASSTQDRSGFWTFGLALLPAILVFAPLILLFNIALGMRMMAVPMVLTLLLLGLAMPVLIVIAEQLRRWVPLLFFKICIVFAALATADYHKQFPEPTQLIYVAGAQAGEAWWASPNENLSPELQTLFGTKAEQKTMDKVFGTHSRYAKFPMWQATAPEAAMAKPIIHIEGVNIVEKRLRVQVKVESPLFANHSFFAVEGSKVLRAKVNGQEYVAQDPEHWSLQIHGRNNANAPLGNRIEFEIEAGKTAQLRVIDTVYQLPAALNHIKTSSNALAMSMSTLDFH